MIKLARRLVNRFGFDIIRRQYSNTDIADHLRNIVAKYDIECILDVGANVGQYGQMLRGIGFTGHIVSFEPVASVFATLAREAQKDPKWHVYQLALGSAAEEKNINLFGEGVFASFHDATDYSKNIWDSLSDQRTERVMVSKLDDLMAQIKSKTGATRFFLKLDTQGHDLDAFHGAVNSLHYIPAMQSELPLIAVYKEVASPYDALKEFNAAGYAISGMYPINRECSLAVIEYDCVLVRRVGEEK